MSRRWPAGLLALSVVFALASTGQCKPPDLPNYQNVIVLPQVSEFAADPALLKAYGLLNNYPIQVLKVEDFCDPSAPCGEEISEVPVPEAIRRTPSGEPYTPSHWQLLLEVSPFGKQTGHDHGVVEGVRLLHEASAAMKKAHELKHCGDYAAAVKCLEQARESVAGTAYAAWIDETLKAASSHYASLEAIQHKTQELLEAERYLFERHSIEAVHPTKYPLPDSTENDGHESFGYLHQHFDALKAACMSELMQASQVYASSPSLFLVKTRHRKRCGSCWFTRVGEVARKPRNEASTVKVVTGCKAARTFVRPICPAHHEVVVVNGSVCQPKTCCSMAAHFHGMPLISALEHFRGATGCRVVIDFEGLHKAGVSPVHPVWLDVQGLPLYCALDLMLRPHRLQATVDGDVIKITCTAECRVVAGSTEPATCAEDACPRCAILHARAVKAEELSRDQLAKKVMVNGLMKACWLSLMDGRIEKAAALARQAHALDPDRIENDPMVIKLDLLEQYRPCSAPKANGAACPAGAEEASEGPEGQTKLVPHLPGPFADVVEALDAIGRQCEKPNK